MKEPLTQGPGNTPDTSGANPHIVRGVAICSGLGGLFLVGYAILMNLKPRGCIAEECVGRSYREAGPMDSILFLAAIGLIIATAVGLFQMHRFGGRGSRAVRIAALVAAVSLLIGVGLTPVFFYLALAALISAVLAFAATGAGLMRSSVLPAWSGALLIVASLLLFGANTENEQILFVIPFGITWIILGRLLWSAASFPADRWHARTQHA